LLPLSLFRRSTVIAMQRPCPASISHDLSVRRSDKNVVLFIHPSNQYVTSYLPRLFDGFFRSVTPPGAMPESNPCRLSHHFILS